jgi:succinate dehydrogenase / fumarate reductase cytochrome b subunit
MRDPERTYYHLKRLHSLTGIVPIGLFLFEHFFTNSFSVQGAEAFNRAAETLGHIPYVLLVELGGILLPILFHMVLGVIIATQSKPNNRAYGYAANWQYLAQRATGVFLVAFITYHVATTRFSPQVLGGDSDLFALMVNHLRSPGVFAFYVLGVLAASYHLGNGLFGFAIHWGLATGARAQRVMARVGFAVFLVFALVGINSLFGFLDRPLRLFDRPAAIEIHVEAQP